MLQCVAYRFCKLFKSLFTRQRPDSNLKPTAFRKRKNVCTMYRVRAYPIRWFRLAFDHPVKLEPDPNKLNQIIIKNPYNKSKTLDPHSPLAEPQTPHLQRIPLPGRRVEHRKNKLRRQRRSPLLPEDQALRQSANPFSTALSFLTGLGLNHPSPPSLPFDQSR